MRGKKRPPAERMHALALAEVRGVEEASLATGIPQRTIYLWMEDPRYAELRSKTREDLTEGFRALAHLAMSKLMEAVTEGRVEPRDLAIVLGVATDKHLLMSGEPTTRSETRTWTDDLDDDEKRRLRDWIDSLDDPASLAGAEPSPDVAEPAGPEIR